MMLVQLNRLLFRRFPTYTTDGPKALHALPQRALRRLTLHVSNASDGFISIATSRISRSTAAPCKSLCSVDVLEDVNGEQLSTSINYSTLVFDCSAIVDFFFFLKKKTHPPTGVTAENLQQMRFLPYLCLDTRCA